jgi:uncharacterized protein YqfA (UPF0365 family)
MSYLNELAEAIGGDGEERVRIRVGEVTVKHLGDVDIVLGDGSTVIENVPHFTHLDPQVGDVVVCLQSGPSLVILGHY